MLSRKDVDLKRQFKFRHILNKFDGISENFYEGIPIMAANMDGVGTFEMARSLASKGMITCLTKTYSIKEIIDFFNNEDSFVTDFAAVSIGIKDEDIHKLKKIYDEIEFNKFRFICIDVANGYTERFSQFVRQVRTNFPEFIIIAGNVVTKEMTEQLILSGADIVKVGIGPGSVCTTRIKTGVGYPQLSAIIECADAAHGLDAHIIADGGCKTPGDVAKAFAAGADFVMLGGMLSGHKEGGGEIIEKHFRTNEVTVHENFNDMPEINSIYEKKQFVQFYGMSSQTANEKHFGGLQKYRASEGRTVLVPYKGYVIETMSDILGGLSSTCTYTGATKLKNLSKCTTFIRCNNTHNKVYEENTIGN